MPKKIKKTTDKKKSKKPRVKSTKPKVAVRPSIMTQVRTPCCVDVLKTGQAYSLPLGFSDIKGTQRTAPGPAPVAPAPVAPSSQGPAKGPSGADFTGTAFARETALAIRKPQLTQQKAFSATFIPVSTEEQSTQTMLSTVGKTPPVYISTKKVPTTEMEVQTSPPLVVKKPRKPRKAKAPFVPVGPFAQGSRETGFPQEMVSALTVPSMTSLPPTFNDNESEISTITVPSMQVLSKAPQSSIATTKETKSSTGTEEPIQMTGRRTFGTIRQGLEDQYLNLTGSPVDFKITNAELKKKITALKRGL